MLQVIDPKTGEPIQVLQSRVVEDSIPGQVLLDVHGVEDNGDATPSDWAGVPLLWNGRRSKITNGLQYQPDGRGTATVRLQVYF